MIGSVAIRSRTSRFGSPAAAKWRFAVSTIRGKHSRNKLSHSSGATSAVSRACMSSLFIVKVYHTPTDAGEVCYTIFHVVTSFIFGTDNGTAGVAARTLGQIRDWPPGLRVFGQVTLF